MNLYDIFGWLGFAVVLGSYALVATRRWCVRSVGNQVGNILGPGFLGINSFFYEAWVLVALNAIWASIAFYILSQIIGQEESVR